MGYLIFILWLILTNAYKDYFWPTTLMSIFAYAILKFTIYYTRKLIKYLSENRKYNNILSSRIELINGLEIKNYEIELQKPEELWANYKNEKVELIDNSGEIINICEKCGGYMRIVKWRGSPFLGCSNYPNCRSSRPLNDLYNLSV